MYISRLTTHKIFLICNHFPLIGASLLKRSWGGGVTINFSHAFQLFEQLKVETSQRNWEQYMHIFKHESCENVLIHCIVKHIYRIPPNCSTPSFLGPRNILCLQLVYSKFSFCSFKENNLIFIWLIQH